MSEQNYSQMSLRELYDVFNSLDKETEKEKVEEVLHYIKLKQNDPNRKSGLNLAGRGERLLAVILDGLIMLLPMLLIIYFLVDFKELLNNPTFHFMFTLKIFVAGQILYVAVNGYTLFKDGQSLGKKVLDIKIIDRNGNVPDFTNIFFIRYFLASAIGLVPILGSLFALLDPLFIISEKKRCIHDLMAGTDVVSSLETKTETKPED